MLLSELAKVSDKGIIPIKDKATLPTGAFTFFEFRVVDV
jgi:hypothetical protein